MDELYIHGWVNVHPNRGTKVAALMVATDRKQYNLRVCEPISEDLTDHSYGPLSFIIEEPLKRWRMRLRPNEHIPVSLDLVGTPAFPLYDFGHRVIGDDDRYFGQLIQWNGEATVEGKPYRIEGYLGMRDRGWGLRDIRFGASLQFFHWLHFADYGLLLIYAEDREQNPKLLTGALIGQDGAVDRVIGLEHDMEYESGTRLWTKWRELLTFEKAGKRELLCRRVGPFNLTAGSGVLERSYLERGSRWIEGEIYDTTDHAFLRSIGKWGKQYVVEAQLGSDIGYGFVEDAVSLRSRYGRQLAEQSAGG
ncbi:MAG TPA: hypothetical protein VNL95_01855 [Dehalococcoidia bacterium]|nr:hypothetical protein [Dehalococcoidia bacterium]